MEHLRHGVGLEYNSVACGYSQIPGVDFTDVYSPVVHDVTFRIMLVDRVRVVVAHFVTIRLALNSNFRLNCQHKFKSGAAGRL